MAPVERGRRGDRGAGVGVSGGGLYNVRMTAPPLFALLLAAAAGPPAALERGGLVVVEAETFASQTRDEVRRWHLTTADETPAVAPDGDPNHADTASGGAYLEVLPDTRRTHDDELVGGENFAPEPGGVAVLSYPVRFETPGRYYVWVRAFSTGTEDNGLHVGLGGDRDLGGDWPDSGRRMQWCEGKGAWRWESRQRTEANHCGEPHGIYLDVNEPGDRVVRFSMREDGFEFDRFLLTTDRDFPRPEGIGPPASPTAPPGGAANR